MTDRRSVVERALDAELEHWRTARAQQALIEGRWGAPPTVPHADTWNAAFDPTGRRALLMGPRAVHALDLQTGEARLLLDDPRTGRVGAFAPDGEHAAVVDPQAGRLHWIAFDGAPRLTTHAWPVGRSRRQAAVAVDAAEQVVVVGTGDRRDQMQVLWIDGRTGEVRNATQAPIGRLDDDNRIGLVRCAGARDAVQIALEGSRPRLVEIDVGGRVEDLDRIEVTPGPRPLQRTLHGGPVRIGRAIEVSGGRIVVSEGPDVTRVAVSANGRVGVYDRASGDPVGGPVTAPRATRFSRVGALCLDGDRLWVHGEAGPDPFVPARASLIAAYGLDGGEWRLRGVVMLASRRARKAAGPTTRGERLSNVYVRGVQLTVAELEARGITYTGDRVSPAEAEQARFDRDRTDLYALEVPFAVGPDGVFGRLDADRPLGVDAVLPFERPAAARAALIGRDPGHDDATAEALADWSARLAWWRRTPTWARPETLARLMEASAGLGHLLPEIVHRAPINRGHDVARAGALCRAADKLSRDVDRAPTIFREMLAREERERLTALRIERLAVVCPALADRAADAASMLGRAVELIADAIEGSSPRLELRGTGPLDEVVDLLVTGGLNETLEHLELSAGYDADPAAEVFARAVWPALRHLDLSGSGLTDRGALALADGAGAPALATLPLDRTDVTWRGRAALRFSPMLPRLFVELSTLAAWVGLLELGDDIPAPDGLGAMIERLVASTPGAVIDRAPELGERTASVVWSVDDDRALEIEGVRVTAPALLALGDAAGVRHRRRLALRRCGLDDAMAGPIFGFADVLLDLKALDLRGNRLGRTFALAAAGRATAGRATLALADNPIDPAGWGVLRGAFGERLLDPPADAVNQLAAMAALGEVPLPERAAWLGRAWAAAPDLIEPTAAALDRSADRKALVAAPALGAQFGPDAAEGRRALTAWALRQSTWPMVVWWLGEVRCVARIDAIELYPTRAPTDAQLRLEAEPDDSRLRKLFEGQDVLTGDADFDRVALISGDPGVALAVLDPVARAALTTWLPAGLRLVEGAVTLSGDPEPESIVALADLTARLALPVEPLPEVWARRLREEPVAGVAERLATLLANDPETTLGQLDFAAGCGIESARRRIGEALAARVTPESANHLGAAGLAAALESAPSALRLPLIEQLHAVGDERAVAPLTKLADAFFGSGEVKKAARAAVEAIVKRQGGLRAGGLSVAGPRDVGGLTVADEPD